LLIATLAVAPALAGDASNMAQMVEEWEAAFNAGNAEAVAAMYTEDATRLPYQAPTISGRSAIAENIQANREQGIVKIELKLGGSESQGSMAWAHGTYHLMDADGTTIQKGKWMNVSKKVKGEWLIQSDIWNTDAPE
jgi:uncharacterized protein (TIGR02246 family)